MLEFFSFASSGLFALSISSILVLIAAGASAGFSAGLLGAGGGAILVPVLYYVLPNVGITSDLMRTAIATSLAVMVFTSVSATYKQWQSGYLESVPLFSWLLSVFVGAIAANQVFRFIPEVGLRLAFIAYLLGSAAYMYIHKSELDDGSPLQDIPILKKCAVGGLVGALSTFLGIGGATLTVPFLTSAKYPLKTAFAMSSATGLLVSLTAFIVSAMGATQPSTGAAPTMGFISLSAVVIVAPVCMVFSALGVKANHKLPEYWLKTTYCVLIVGVAASMLYEFL